MLDQKGTQYLKLESYQADDQWTRILCPVIGHLVLMSLCPNLDLDVQDDHAVKNQPSSV